MALVVCTIAFGLIWNSDHSTEQLAKRSQKPITQAADSAGGESPKPVVIEKQTPSHATVNALFAVNVFADSNEKESSPFVLVDPKFWTAVISAILAFLGVVGGLALSRRAESRLRTETLVKWVELLGHEKEQAHVDKRIAACLVLAKSDFVEIALTYLDSTWRQEAKLDAGIAVAIIDEGFKSNSVNLQDLAATTLLYHAEQLYVRRSKFAEFYWPNQIEWRWMSKLTLYARLAIWQALITNLVKCEFDDWDPGTIRGAFVTFHAAMRQDPSDIVKYASARVAQLILNRLTDVGVLCGCDDKYHRISDLLAESGLVAAKPPELLPTGILKLLNEADEWCNREIPLPKSEPENT